MRSLPAAAPRRGLFLLTVALLLAACMSPGASSMGVPSSSPSTSASPDATACGPARSAPPSGWPQPAEIIPIIVSRELTVGENRFLVSIADRTGKPIASPDVAVEVAFHELTTAPDRAVAEQDATFLWTLEGELGLYRTAVEFTCSGLWGVEVTATPGDGEPQTSRAVFDVRGAGTTPVLGAAAPAVATPTAEDEEAVRAISTDDDPDLDFYRESLDDALAAGEPVLLVFATPAFCTSRVCGPTLDIAKTVANDYRDDIALVHVEPFELQLVDGAPQPALSNGQVSLTEPAEVYGLPVEPYIFVIDAEGRVTAKFEGVASEDELREALDAVSRV